MLIYQNYKRKQSYSERLSNTANTSSDQAVCISLCRIVHYVVLRPKSLRCPLSLGTHRRVSVYSNETHHPLEVEYYNCGNEVDEHIGGTY